jgi:hypothetical protein
VTHLPTSAGQVLLASLDPLSRKRTTAPPGTDLPAHWVKRPAAAAAAVRASLAAMAACALEAARASALLAALSAWNPAFAAW